MILPRAFVPPYMQARPKKAAEPARPTPGLAVMEAEFLSKPWGSSGQMLVAPEPQPAPVEQPAGFTIEAPPWSTPEGAAEIRAAIAAEEATPPMTAVEKMMADADALGELEEPPPVGPPLRTAPLERPAFPQVDWQAVQREALEAEREERERLERKQRIELLRQLLEEDESIGRGPA